MESNSRLRRAFAANSTSAAFVAFVDTLTEPSGAGVHDIGKSGLVPDQALISFFGAGADGATFDARIVGWDRIGDDPYSTLWVWRVLASFSVTLSAAVGVAGSAHVAETDRWADTLALGALAEPRYGDVNATPASEYRGTTRIFSPQNDIKAYAIVPLLGCEKLQFDLDMTGATNGNALFRCLRNHT